MFSHKKPPIVGVDISSSAVKVLELSKRGDRHRVERFAVEPLPQKVVVENSIADIERVGYSVGRALKRSGTRCRHVAVGVASSHVITKTVTIPGGLKEQELERQVELEAEQYIPHPLDEVNLDFEVVGASKDNPEDDDVIIAACRKEIVDDYIAVIEQQGLTAAVVDVDAFAVENSFSLVAQNLPGGGMGSTIALLDFGASTTKVNVMVGKRLVYTRDHTFGGRQLTDEIQRRYGLSYEEAGLAKKVGGLPDDYNTEVLTPFKEAMCQETMRALQFFYSSTPYNSIDQIVLAGGCAQIEGVGTTISQRLGVPVIKADPFVNMTLSSSVNEQVLTNDAPALMVACGLALRSFDS